MRFKIEQIKKKILSPSYSIFSHKRQRQQQRENEWIQLQGIPNQGCRVLNIENIFPLNYEKGFSNFYIR